jgi:hypothetical protein
VQKGWISALVGQISYSDENDMIGMAEHIICDTVGARERRLNTRILNTFDAYAAESWSERLTLLFGSRKMRTRFLLAVHKFKEHTCSTMSCREVFGRICLCMYLYAHLFVYLSSFVPSWCPIETSFGASHELS